MARGCGAKHICASKCTKHLSAGAILQVAIRKNGTRVWREAHLCVKMYKTPQRRSHFASRDQEKWRAAVARSTFASQSAKKLTASELSWKFRCWRMARGCGAKHICASKCTKHLSAGAILQVAIRKNGAPLWREAHLQVKIVKNWRVRTTFWRSDVEKWHAAVAPNAFVRRHAQTTCVLQHFPWFLTDWLTNSLTN